jgi:hypothetical protein
MKKQSALRAWTMLLVSLPKGIAAFLTVVAGLSVSLPLSLFLVGLPLLAETLVLGCGMMDAERRSVAAWLSGTRHGEASLTEKPAQWGGWKALLAALGRGKSYRGILYGLLQLPIGIAAFTVAIVLPVTSWAVMLSPLAYQVSSRIFSYELFTDDYVMNSLLADWSPFLRSWLYGGIGLVLVLLMPAVIRGFGRLYAAWILGIAGAAPQPPAAPIIAQSESLQDRLPEPQPNA